MLNPWIILAIVLAWGVSLVGVGYKANKIGHESERVEWQAREREQVTAANAAIKRLNDVARSKERESVDAMAKIGSQLEQEKRSHAKTRAARDTALRSGTERVSVAVTACESPGGSSGAETGTDTSKPPATRAFLHPQVAADLEQLTGEADDTARDLNACLKIAEEDRRIVNNRVVMEGK